MQCTLGHILAARAEILAGLGANRQQMGLSSPLPPAL